MIFHDPLFLLLLILIPIVVYGADISRRKGVIHYPSTTIGAGLPASWKINWLKVLPLLPVGALVLFIVALARPQLGLQETMVRREGIDIVLTLDVSTSMLAEDFQLGGQRMNRVDVVKQVAKDFIAQRPYDRIGIVIYAGRPYILSPLTWDHDWSESRINELKAGMVEDGTAIGSALATALNRLQESKAKSKVIILLTDGMNNAGAIMPETAAEAAKALGITIYTIGAGSKGVVPYPVQDQWGRKVYQNTKADIDEELLKKIAAGTGGRYFRATDTNSLKAIFQRINKLEKTVIEMPHFREYRDLYPYLLFAALLLLLGEAILANTILRRLP